MKRKVAILAAVGILVLLAGMMLSVMLGAKELSIQQVFHGIFGFEGSLDDQLVRDVRLPRMLLSGRNARHWRGFDAGDFTKSHC